MSESQLAAAAVSQSADGAPHLDRSVLWLIRAAALVALGVSLYLSWIAMSNGQAVGCGGSSECEDVLKSRWALLGGMPVSLPGASLYASLFVVLCFVGPMSPPRLARLALHLALVLALAAAGAAIWFSGLQIFVLKESCYYCLAIHLCALLLSLGLLLMRPLPAASLFKCAGLGLACSGVLASWQWFGGPSPRYTLYTVSAAEDETPIRLSFPVERGPATRLNGRGISILGGRAEFDSLHVPLVGSRNAGRIVVVLFDYSCNPCRELRRQLAEFDGGLGRKLAVIPLPVPQHPDCNPGLDHSLASGDDSCELARLALCVWRLAPESFVEFDTWLLAGEKPPSAAAAREEAARLVGKARLGEVLRDGVIDKQIQQLVETSKLSPSDLVPQIIHGDRVLAGSFDSTSELARVLEREMGAQ